MPGSVTSRRSHSLSARKRALYWAVLLLGLAAFAWVASVLARGTVGYLHVKSASHGWRGRLVAFDPTLGTRSVPGASGAEILGGVQSPVRFDASGFRVPLQDRPRPDRPLVLALGDSFTFGSGVSAEETYPWLVAERLGGRVRNAGHPGYGLAEILPLARELVPRHRPDVLLVQASTWLPARARRKLRDGRFGRVAAPHFVSDRQTGAPVWRPPRYRAKVFDLPVAVYRETPAGLEDWASFMVRVGMPLYLHDDPRMLRHLAMRGLRLHRPSAPPEAISAAVYPEILRICQDTGTRMVVVVLEGPGKHNQPQSAFKLPSDVTVVDTKAGLYARLERRTKASYLRAYGHWHGDPPVLTDDHPNADAHAIIAAQILRAMAEDGEGT